MKEKFRKSQKPDSAYPPIENILHPIGQNIRYYRNRLGATIEEIAFYAEMEASHLGEIERGVYNLHVYTLYKIAQALLIPITALFSPTPSQKEKDPLSQEDPFPDQLEQKLSCYRDCLLHLNPIQRKYYTQAIDNIFRAAFAGNLPSTALQSTPSGRTAKEVTTV